MGLFLFLFLWKSSASCSRRLKKEGSFFSGGKERYLLVDYKGCVFLLRGSPRKRETAWKHITRSDMKSTQNTKHNIELWCEARNSPLDLVALSSHQALSSTHSSIVTQTFIVSLCASCVYSHACLTLISLALHICLLISDRALATLHSSLPPFQSPCVCVLLHSIVNR